MNASTLSSKIGSQTRLCSPEHMLSTQSGCIRGRQSWDACQHCGHYRPWGSKWSCWYIYNNMGHGHLEDRQGSSRHIGATHSCGFGCLGFSACQSICPNLLLLLSARVQTQRCIHLTCFYLKGLPVCHMFYPCFMRFADHIHRWDRC